MNHASYGGAFECIVALNASNRDVQAPSDPSMRVTRGYINLESLRATVGSLIRTFRVDDFLPDHSRYMIRGTKIFDNF